MLVYFTFKKKRQILLSEDSVVLLLIFHTSSGVNKIGILFADYCQKEAQGNYSKTKVVILGSHSIAFNWYINNNPIQ